MLSAVAYQTIPMIQPATTNYTVFVQNSSVLLVQADEGVSGLVVDRIGDIYRSLPRRADVIVTTVGARHKCQQGARGGAREELLLRSAALVFRSKGK
ncbi:hypothetical protein F511_43763 [Dorcoceras hygrometricum]|uniref:Uncharacterized protein n=1 Tax=Dorcoceras hygrometricum TaxID=472368 RepID=A0A2Z7BAZ2_9LAMI|nr:hypothetical protein F511_43763 [Dorcoceras hygrometricum]